MKLPKIEDKVEILGEVIGIMFGHIRFCIRTEDRRVLRLQRGEFSVKED